MPPVNLFHHSFDITALGDAMAMTAVGAGDAIAVAKLQANPDRRSLLAGIEVNEARNTSSSELIMDPILEHANGTHVAVGLD